MKLKQFITWSTRDLLKSFTIFYVIYISIHIALFALLVAYGGQAAVHLNDGTAQVFLLVAGIVIFGQNLKMGIANGVSRKTVFLGGTITALISTTVLVVSMLICDLLFSAIFSATGLQGNTDQWTVETIVNYIALTLSSGLMGIFGGMFIGGAYYRMSKTLRIVVSVGVPAGLIFGIPLLFRVLPEMMNFIVQHIYSPIVEIAFATPTGSFVFFSIIAVIGLVLTWLLILRAPIRSAK